LLLLHAGLADRRMWDPQWDELAERFTALRLDSRGFGESDDPMGPFTLHDDAIEVLDDAGIERASVVGCSMGGGAALDLALVAPERVESLVIANSTPSGWEHDDEIKARWQEINTVFERDGVEAASELEMQLWLDGFGREIPLDREIRDAAAAANLAVFERQAAAEMEIEPGIPDPPAIERLAELKPRTLVMIGGYDVPSSRAGCEAIVAGATTERVDFPHSAHLINVEQPREFLAELLSFLAAQPV
jgi:3-oxoadipate enol-lactonase